MKRRLASLFLLLVLFGSAFAGVPLGFGENHCSMSGMANMPCCKSMLKQKSRPKVSATAELLCALACAKSGSTLPASSVRLTPPALARTIEIPATAQLTVIAALRFQQVDRSHDPPGSPPKYLRNLALLI
jgi:hypothetical protein